MKTFTSFVGAAAFLVANSAAAAVVTATDVVDANVGTVLKSDADSDRYIAANALGPADGEFFSLGRDGDITLGFGGTISGTTEIGITEVTYGSMGHIATYGEAVDVFAVLDGDATLVGRLTNYEAYTGHVLSYTGVFDSLRFADATGDAFGDSPSFDGFDIDSVELATAAAIPLPATGGLVLTGLVGLGLLRRRR